MKVKRFEDDGTKGLMLSVSTTEALQLIQSLSSQIIAKNPNGSGRHEHYAEDGTYVSIAVNPDLDSTVSSSTMVQNENSSQ